MRTAETETRPEVKIQVELAGRKAKPEILVNLSRPSKTLRLGIDEAGCFVRALQIKIREARGLPRMKQPPTR